MEPLVFTAVTILTSTIFEKAGSNVGKKLVDYLKQQLNESATENQKAHTALDILESGGDRNASNQTIEVIAEAVQDKIDKDPEFENNIREELKTLIQELRKDNPQLAKQIESQTKSLETQIVKIDQDVEDIRKKIENLIRINVAEGDFVGKDPYVLSGNQNVINQHFYYNGDNFIGDNTTNSGSFEDAEEKTESSSNPTASRSINSEGTEVINVSINSVSSIQDRKYYTRVLAQIGQIKGKITQYFTVKKSMDELDEIRQPRRLGSLYVKEAVFEIPFFLGRFSFLWRRPEEIRKNEEKHDLTAEDYLKAVRDIESQLQANASHDEALLKRLGNIADEINFNISTLNNSFILAIYPASACRELVENMASKVGYRELREEAEMHLSVISRLVEKLNYLVKRFDIERLNEKSQDPLKGNVSPESIDAIRLLVNSLNRAENSQSAENIISLVRGVKNENESKSVKPLEKLDQSKAEDNSESQRIYILSDESQATIGMMIDIEKRKLLVESLVQLDRKRRNQTTSLVTFAIILVIGLIATGGILNGPLFTVGDKSLDSLKLPLLNVPWPVVFWSFVGSFAAMIYRFNRQPIHEFGNVIKWTITRLVQGVVLGSAFYLILVSGLALLTGISLETSDNVAQDEIATEVILVLTFLVGFSDRFADTIFNTLIDKYIGSSSEEGQA
ncbi:MAG: hypothetical protein AAF821_20355 [Cyanobacteria bacterium P01_D01_bin.156]